MPQLELRDEDFENEECDVEEELIEQDLFSANIFRSDVSDLVKSYMDTFFANKRMHCGGPVKKSLLHHPKRIHLVINTSISEGVEIAYSGLERNIAAIDLANSKKTGESTSDIKLVNETLKILAKAGIPQQFAGGLLVLYLEFCEGVKF